MDITLRFVLVEEGIPPSRSALERALFDDHFEVVRVSGEEMPLELLESSFGVLSVYGFGLVIYSSDALAPEAKRRG